MKKTCLYVILFLIIVSIPHSVFAKKKKVIDAVAGAVIAGYGIIIDGSYDSTLDNVVPGYKMINVVVVNQSFNIIYFDPRKDKWSVNFLKDKKVRAIYNMRREDPKTWSKLPVGIKNRIGYPLVLPIGAREVIDIFVPSKYNLNDFNEFNIYLKSLNTEFRVMATQ